MVNKEIARQFNLLASLMELHGENAFKTKAYANAYLALRKWDKPIESMTSEEIDAIPGIGHSVISKIKELLSTGSIEALDKLKEKTPEGIQQILSVKGLGPKKVRVIWDELKVESPAELLQACNENRLVQLSGFGLKTQEDLKQKIAYFFDSQNKYLYGNIEAELELLLQKLKKGLPGHRIEWVGEYATKCPIVNKIECLIAPVITPEQIGSLEKVVISESTSTGICDILYDDHLTVRIHTCDTDDFLIEWANFTMEEGLFEKIAGSFNGASRIDQVLEDGGFPDLPLELMDKEGINEQPASVWTNLVTVSDLKGILHNHSTWSDGINTLEEMSVYVRDAGYEYFGICDHSRSAFYANGLSAERVLAQMDEIDALNKKLAPFKVFKGIESDILGDGSLDYDADILARFDFVVASIHSNLRMDEEKAMSRLIHAIENPHTKILGHPTGRLLLARQGYPINHRRIIDACAANEVAIELNANPLRLDIDYKWMDYCMEKEVWVSINPDAHSRAQVDYVKYGVNAARKGGLKLQYCLNALSLDQFTKWLGK
jgi:DNA polymerase (family X)